MAAKYGLEIRNGPRQRVSGYADYRPFYTDSLIDLVSSTWQREIELFGFDFDLTDNRHHRPAVLRRLATCSYVWRHDELKIRRPGFSDVGQRALAKMRL